MGEISATLSFAYISLAILLLFLAFVGHIRHAPTSQSLHFLLLRPGRFLTHISTWVPLSIPSELCADVTGSERPSSHAGRHWPSLGTATIYVNTHCPHSSPFKSSCRMFLYAVHVLCILTIV